MSLQHVLQEYTFNVWQIIKSENQSKSLSCRLTGRYIFFTGGEHEKQQVRYTKHQVSERSVLLSMLLQFKTDSFPWLKAGPAGGARQSRAQSRGARRIWPDRLGDVGARLSQTGPLHSPCRAPPSPDRARRAPPTEPPEATNQSP